MENYDLIVIGGGVLGTFHAYHALEMGKKVLLIERNRVPMGSSVQNFGQVVPSGMDRKWQALGRKSLDIYKTIQAKFDISVRQQGSVYLASDPDEMLLLEELATINRHNDYGSELLTPSQCLDRYPGLRSDYCVGGLFFPDEVTVEPQLAVYRILSYLASHKGLNYLPNTLAIDVETVSDQCKVTTSDRRKFYASKVLICNGFECQTLFPQLYNKSDLQLVKLQMLRIVPQPTQRLPGSILTGLSIRRYESFRECPSYTDVKAREGVPQQIRDWGIHILFKQAIDGSIILGDSHAYAHVSEPDQLRPLHIDTDINNFMLQEAQDIFNLQDWRVKETWAGCYTQCADNDVFTHTIDDRVHLLTGIGGKGMTASAGFAQQHIQTIFS